MVAWATPNWMELSALTGLPVASLGQAEAAMHHLGRSYPHLTIVATGGDQARHRPAGHAARGLHQHVQFVALGKAPHDLAHVIERERG